MAKNRPFSVRFANKVARNGVSFLTIPYLYETRSCCSVQNAIRHSTECGLIRSSKSRRGDIGSLPFFRVLLEKNFLQSVNYGGRPSSNRIESRVCLERGKRPSASTTNQTYTNKPRCRTTSGTAVVSSANSCRRDRPVPTDSIECSGRRLRHCLNDCKIGGRTLALAYPSCRVASS